VTYAYTIGGERYRFADLKMLLANANEVKSGDQLAGVAADSERRRVAAKCGWPR
jgi:ethanolamine ammonia-lyase large subunit